ncbi:MAG: zinc metallopeptidase [Bacteroidales bacterium]|nr:zinc metallopeptidase [Candidatus Sodaliphilus aphodohippi]
MAYLIFIAVTIISWLAQRNITSKFKKYSAIPLGNGMTGRDVAAAMLRAHNVAGVKIGSVAGELTDHYNPTNMTLNLSQPVYGANSVAAAAVAAHECGHAVQHATGYSMLRLRSSLVPAVNFASKWMPWVLLAGILLLELTPIPLEIGIALFACTTLFSLVTLPVEVDASRRATRWLEGAGIVRGQELEGAKDALHAAAYTYVAAALGSLATLAYYVMMFIMRRD